MPVCSKCGRWYEISPGGEHCPHCEASASEASEVPAMAPVARIHNWAEAGFFQDLLHSHGINAQLQQQDRFDALSGSWHPILLLLVPIPDQERAEQIMQTELAEPESEAEAAWEPWDAHRDDPDDPGSPWNRPQSAVAGGPADDFSNWEPNASASPPLWKPLAVVLVAGGLAYLGARMIRGWPPAEPAARAEPNPARTSPELWDYLTRHEEVWEQQPSAGGPRRRMWHDPEQGIVHIEEDGDSDGHFERRLQFRQGRMIQEGLVPSSNQDTSASAPLGKPAR